MAAVSTSPCGILRLGRIPDPGDGAMISNSWMLRDETRRWHANVNPPYGATGGIFCGIKERIAPAPVRARSIFK
jgi:hypothetical protein